MGQAVFSLGSNIEPRESYIKNAKSELKKYAKAGFKQSKLYLTAPVGFKSGNEFINAAVAFDTSISPDQWLDIIKEIESRSGRQRVAGMVTDRTIDVDLILYDNMIVNSGNLILPHPRMHERLFVLVPLLDIVPDMIHPVLQKSIWEIYADSKISGEITLFE